MMCFSTILGNKETRKIVTKRKKKCSWAWLHSLHTTMPKEANKKETFIFKKSTSKHLSQKTLNMKVNRLLKATAGNPRKLPFPGPMMRCWELVFASFAIFPLKRLYLSLETERKWLTTVQMVLKTPPDKKCIQLHHHKESRDIKRSLISLIIGTNPVTEESQYLVLKRIWNV